MMYNTAINVITVVTLRFIFSPLYMKKHYFFIIAILKRTNLKGAVKQ